MSHQNVLPLFTQAVFKPVIEEIRAMMRQREDQTIALIVQFLMTQVSPAGAFRFEKELDALEREGSRQLIEWLFNQIDPEIPSEIPPRIEVEGTEYRRREKRTPHRDVATLFGNITLWRYGYRPCEESGECHFPIEEALGLVEGCTPALAERAAFLGGRAGATQRDVLQSLRRDNNVILGTQRLRDMWHSVASSTEPLRCDAQARKVCDWLRDAASQSGITPTLAVGRDGITVANQTKASYEVASCGTVSVYAGKKRLGTVYLGFAPESGQPTMTEALLALLHAILTLLHAEGRPQPQLCYVSDCGELEESFYTSRLSRMRHPVTGKRLSWQRAVDYFHASQRLTTIGDSLKWDEASVKAWTRKMREVLKGPKGVGRVLRSAAALAKRHGFKNEEKKKEYETACNYLRKRSAWMRYDEFRERGLPIGSGVTEAGCKTLFTQRVKQSGMRWKHPGMQAVLNLRVLVLSGIWDGVYAESLERLAPTMATIPSGTQPVVSQQTPCAAA